MEQKDATDCNDWTWHIKNSAMPRLMDRFNSLMQSVCSDENPKCIYVGGVLKVKWEPDDFVDKGHFSRKGGAKFADVISKVILSKSKEEKLYNRIQNDFLNIPQTPYDPY